MFSGAVGREGRCKQITLACARSVSATLGLPPFTVCVLSWSTLFRFQVALQGNCLRPSLGCVHFPGLRHSGSGSRVLHKGTDSVGPTPLFCSYSITLSHICGAIVITSSLVPTITVVSFPCFLHISSRVVYLQHHCIISSLPVASHPT